MRLPILGSGRHTTDSDLAPRPGFRVALVYPPFGPSGLPSLGLALLSAGLKARSLECRTFYWNFDVIAEMPGEELGERLDIYRVLSGRHFMPFNEWAFAHLVHGDALRQRENETRGELARFLAQAYPARDVRARLEREVLSLRERAAEMVDAMAERLEPYAMVGINSTFYQNLPALALAKRVKERWPEKTVVFGGANCDGDMGRALIEKFGFVDCVFSGEVDHAFPDFAVRLSRGDDVGGTPGLLRRDREGRIEAGPRAEPLADLDALPLPDFDDFIQERRRVGIDEHQELTLALESSRGCWWGARQHCTFCGLNANGMGYRQKSAQRFQWELERMAERYGARFIFMADNILSMDYFGRFMDWAAGAPRRSHFFYEIKSNLNRKQVARLAAAGVTAVQPGIESFSSKILALMRKGTTGAQNIAFLKYAREYGIYTAYNLLVGFPGEDEREYDRLAAELPKLFHLRPPSSVPEVEFHRFSPYHQTPERFGLRLRSSASYRHLYPFPEEDVARIAYSFEREDEPAPAPRRYLERLIAQIARWHEAYKEDDCSLTWEADGMDVVIDDHRPDFPRRRYRLRNHAAAVFHATDFPKSQKLLLRDAEQAPPDDTTKLLSVLFASPGTEGEELIDFDRREFLERPAACLGLLTDAGLLYVEDDKLLSLAVRRDFRRMEEGWLKIGV